MKSKIVKSLGVALVLGSIPMAWAQTVADLPPQKWADYAWPTESSSEPKADEWEKAIPLEMVKMGEENRWAWWNVVTCKPRVVREWVQLTCGAPPKENGEVFPFFGALWGMAGDLSTIKASFTPASELEKYKAPPKNDDERWTQKLGVRATTVFQIKPGSAFVIQFDELFWNENYEGTNLEPRTGMLVDVSWALGEKSPSIFLR